MDLVRGAMGSLLPKLLKLLGDEYKLQTGMKKEVKFISQELESTHAFLRKVSDVPWYELDVQTKAWAHEAREASYKMEDVLDIFLVRFEDREPTSPNSLRRAMKKMANLFSKGKARRDISCAIQDIKNRLQDLADRHARYRIDDIVVNRVATTSTVDPRLQAMYKEVSNLVGINKPAGDFISMLTDDMSSRKKKVAIVGIGGLGKTTLAKTVYDILQMRFDCCAFIPVGRNPNLTKVLMDILYELDKIKFADIHTKNRDERQLINILRDFLVNKRYIIVIDDIWENKSWDEIIELALPENNCGCIIIITTRNSEVATEICDEVYKMQPLSDHYSKRLFSTRIFGDEGKFPDNQRDEVPNKILKKCGGIPLAIITMASLLVGKPREGWSDVLSSIGFGHKDNKQVENTTKILSYSYYDMPSYLRTCLLYLCVFPEDYYIQKDSLIRMWIAEGFIQGNHGIRLYELGERYFTDLVNRNMVQAIDSHIYGLVQGCRIHDMVLDLIRSISSEENMVTILYNNEGIVTPHPWSSRRIALHDITMDTAHGNMVDIPQLRSLISIRCPFGNQVSLSSIKLLRVLDMKACKNVNLSHLVHLENLLHLRYLGLEDTRIDDLPDEIGALKLLQTLNLDNTGIRQLTTKIRDLTQLVCLKCNCLGTLKPNLIRKLTCLEDLQVAIDFCNNGEEDHARGFLKELGSLCELRLLSCNVFNMDESMQQDLMFSLCNLQKLECIDFHCTSWIDTDSSVWEESGFVLSRHLRILHLLGFKFSVLPSCISAGHFPNLTHLCLCVYAMDQKGMEFLGMLPELYYLWLFTVSTVTISINASNRYFQKLRFCMMPQSMIQFQWKEQDSSILFHIHNGINAMPLDCSKNDRKLAQYAAMPNLEVLHARVYLGALIKDGESCGNIGWEYLPSLRKVQMDIFYDVGFFDEAQKAERALRKATEIYPKRPMLITRLLNVPTMMSAIQDQETEDDDLSTEEEGRQEGELTVDEDVTNSSIVNS